MGMLLISHILNIASLEVHFLANEILEAIANLMVIRAHNLLSSGESLAERPSISFFLFIGMME